MIKLIPKLPNKKKEKSVNNLLIIRDDKPPKHRPLLPFIVTFVFILIVLATISAFVIYIRNRKSASHKHVIIDHKPSAFKYINDRDQYSCIDEDDVDRSKKNPGFK